MIIFILVISSWSTVNAINETLYPPPENKGRIDFQHWYTDGIINQYSVSPERGLIKDCTRSFVETQVGHFYSPVIDVHPESDIIIAIQIKIQPCRNIDAETESDILKICSPVLDLAYVKLDSFDQLFFEVSPQEDHFSLIVGDGLNENAEFIAIDSVSDKNYETDTYTTREFRIQSISGKIQFRFKDEGTCFTLKSFVVYRDFCPSFTRHLQYFSRTYARKEQVVQQFGKCVSDSVSVSQSNSLSSMMCGFKGNWINQDTISSDCECRAGFEPNQNITSCLKCEPNFYKQLDGNEKCSECPPNSVSETSGSVSCKCKDRYSRYDEKEATSSCIRPIKQYIQNVKALPFDEFVKFSWSPIEWGESSSGEPIVYVVNCKAMSDPTESGSTVEDASSLVLSGLKSSKMYNCSIGAKNRITSDLKLSYMQIKTGPSLLVHDVEIRKVGMEKFWFLNWSPPADLDKLTVKASQFSDDSNNATRYTIYGYVIRAMEESQNRRIVDRIVFNTTANLNALFPPFKNNFDNVTFRLFPIHQIDDIQVNSTMFYDVISHRKNYPGGSTGGGSWIQGMPRPYVFGSIAATLFLILFVLICVLVFAIQSRRTNNDNSMGGYGMTQTGFAPPPGSGGHYNEPLYIQGSGYPLNTLLIQGPGGVRMVSGGGICNEVDIENNYEDLELFRRETGAPTDFIQNNISKTQLSSKEKIGKGRFSIVYRARYTYHERVGGRLGSILVAVKEPTVGCSAYESDREIDIMAKIKHPNIVSLIGIVQPCGPTELQQIVMEYMEFGSLEQFLQANRSHNGLTTTDFMFILLDVAKAMSYLHSNNYIHRDLAARNVLVGKYKSSSASDPSATYNGMINEPAVICKLSDFGLCRSVDNGDLTYDFVNSRNPLVPIRWLAPEVADKKLATFAGDVWSFAVVTWEVFSYGQRPYWRWDTANILGAVNDGYRLPIPPECPLSVYEELLAPCWRGDPTQRPSFIDIVARIEEFLVNVDMLQMFSQPSNFNPFHLEAKELVLKSENNVERWLKLLKMEQHWSKFEERNLLHLTDLTNISYSQLKNDFGIQLVGNRRKLIQSIEVIRELQNEHNSSSSNQDASAAMTRQSVALVDQSMNNWCFSSPSPNHYSQNKNESEM